MIGSRLVVEMVAIRRFSDFRNQCEAAMAGNDSLKILNDVHENKRMVSKLPDWLIHSWGRKVVSEWKIPPSEGVCKICLQGIGNCL